MDPVVPLEWGRILLGEQPPTFLLEIIARVFIIYVVSLIVLRAGGKRERKQITPLELLLFVALGSAVGDVLFYPSVAKIYAVLILFLIIVLQWLVERLKRKSGFLENFINSKPKMLIKFGKVLPDALDKENFMEEELFSALREKGISNLGQVEYAFLELSGTVSVFKYEKGKEIAGKNILPLEQNDDFMSS